MKNSVIGIGLVSFVYNHRKIFCNCLIYDLRIRHHNNMEYLNCHPDSAFTLFLTTFNCGKVLLLGADEILEARKTNGSNKDCLLVAFTSK